MTAESTWRKPLRWDRAAAKAGKQRFVFCASLADVFEDHPALEEPRRRLFDEVIERTPSLVWLVLTKRPESARDWLLNRYALREPDPLRRECVDRLTACFDVPLGVLTGTEFPPNLWIGTSIENARWTWRADALREIPCARRFISAEPLLGSIARSGGAWPAVVGERDKEGDGRPASASAALRSSGASRAPLDLCGIDWVICGGESGGRKARPMRPAWARGLRDACGRDGVSFFFKQWGSWSPEQTLDGERMVYRGPQPTAGGHLLDGVEWSERPAPFPVHESTLA